MDILINPGSGPVGREVSWDNAYENIKAYIADCEIPMRVHSMRTMRGGICLF